MSEIQKPLCTAPFTALLVDTNKGVRPCCTYEDKYLGNLKEKSVEDIRQKPEWKKLQQDLLQGRWPKGCVNCKEREEATGWSLRLLFQPEESRFQTKKWQDEKITYLEFSGSNICNLACLHCNPGYSSKWISDYQKLMSLDPSHPDVAQANDEFYRTYQLHQPNTDIIAKNLDSIDLSEVKTINFKGGEPLLNPETEFLLEHLKLKKALPNLEIVLSTNGTVLNKKFLELAQHARKVVMNVSIDAHGALNQYIRHGPSHTDEVEKFIDRVSQLPNIELHRATALMALNAHHLVLLRDWWRGLAQKNKRIFPDSPFTSVVMSPEWLHPQVLTEAYRHRQIDLLRKHQIGTEFTSAIHTLEKSEPHPALRDRFKKFITSIESIRKNSIRAIEPELADEIFNT